MSEPDTGPPSRSAFADITLPVESGGMEAAQRDGLALVSVSLRRGRRAALASCIRDHFRLELPAGPVRNAHGAVAILGLGPERWWVTSEGVGREVDRFVASVTEIVADVASVADQSDAYGVLRLSGVRAYDALSAHLPIDLHPRVFVVGTVAITACAYINLVVWRHDDKGTGIPVFDVAVPRSLVSTFCRDIFPTPPRSRPRSRTTQR